MFDLIWRGMFIGIVATVVLDIWALFLNRSFGLPFPNWALVGRWFAHLPRGVFVHSDIGKTPAFPAELSVGWAAHYAVGGLFGCITVLLGGAPWMSAPTWPLPLIVGWLTVGCGWFILQPGMGAGMAASKRPDRWRVRLLNILGHTVFGLAMFGAAQLVRL